MAKVEKKAKPRSAGEVARLVESLQKEVVKHLGPEWSGDIENIVEALDDMEKYGETRRTPSGEDGKSEEDVDEDDFV